VSRFYRSHPDWDPDDDLPIHPPTPRCLCSHALSIHYRDRKDRPTCGIAACGCVSPREDTR
jgi:hypothetical protein